MDSPLRPVITRLEPLMRRGDLVAFQQTLEQLADQGRRLSPAQLSLAIAELAPVLAKGPKGFFVRLADLAATWIDDGGSPVPLGAAPTSAALLALWCRGRFEELWPVVGEGRPMPDPQSPPGTDEMIGLFRAAAVRVDLNDQAVLPIALSWYDAPSWVAMLTGAMTSRQYRDTAGDLPHLLDVATTLVGVVPGAEDLVRLARVLDDEPLVVLDGAGGSGYQLTMSGVGDNAQLEILLADRLIGDPDRGLVDGDRPSAAWVDRATSGPPMSPADDRIRSCFAMEDGNAEPLRPDGLPADIPVVADSRVIVLHPPNPVVSWRSGRPFDLMVPTLTLDHIMTDAEVAEWYDRIES